MIDYIKIYGLHEEMDISLKFNDSVKIIIGDNGSGKTTVLNALYYILTKDFVKLSGLSFTKIELKIKGAKKIIINKIDLYNGWEKEELYHPAIRDFLKYINEIELIEFLDLANNGNFNQVRRSPSFRRLLRSNTWNETEIHTRLIHVIRYKNKKIEESDSKQNFLFEEFVDSNSLTMIKEIINDHVKGTVLYLPTYRRVEEAIKNFGDLDDESISKSPLIKFGMEDVEQRFKKIQRELRDSAVKLYSNLNGKMLTQLASTQKASKEDFLKIENIDALKIVFARVGDSISRDTEENIFSLIHEGHIKQERYHPLVFVLSNLIDVYDEQKKTDESIKSFIEIANKYLVKKEFIYDENNVEISVINKKSKNIVTLENLSSGEKQLLSLFSLLYLEKEENYIVIFDEPELSLSIEWQEMLLPDMLNSGKCKFLVAATHSPFIFENELDSKTGIIEVMKEYS